MTKTALLEDIAVKFIQEKERNGKLQKEVLELTKELSLRKYTTRKGFKKLKTIQHRELLASKLPENAEIEPSILENRNIILGAGMFGSVTVGYMSNLNIEVAIKTSKGSSQDVEGRVYQALSGYKHFLHYFGMSSNKLVLQLVQVFDIDKNRMVSSTLSHALDNVSKTKRYPWIEISHGIITGILKLHSLNILHNDIKENNILLQVTSENVVPKIFDFGKATHSSCSMIYNLSNDEKKYYNEHCRHLAFELRNLQGHKQNFSTDAFSVGRVLKQIGGVFCIDKIKVAGQQLKVDDYNFRAKLNEVNLFC